MYNYSHFAIIITLGGMKVIGYTDVIYKFSFDTRWSGNYFTLALNLVSDHYGNGNGIFHGYQIMTQKHQSIFI